MHASMYECLVAKDCVYNGFHTYGCLLCIMHACIYVCIYVRVYLCMSVRMYVCRYCIHSAQVGLHVCIYIYVCMYVFMYLCTSRLFFGSDIALVGDRAAVGIARRDTSQKNAHDVYMFQGLIRLVYMCMHACTQLCMYACIPEFTYVYMCIGSKALM